MWNKHMKSLSSSPCSSPSHSIQPPENPIPQITPKPKRKHKIRNILNTLSTQPKQKKSKREVYIHQETTLLTPKLLHNDDDDDDGIMKEFNVNDIIDQSKRIQRDFQSLTTTKKPTPKPIEIPDDDDEDNDDSKTIESFHNRQNHGVKSLEKLIHNDDKIKELTQKYKHKPHINTHVIQSYTDIQRLISQYESQIIAILKGEKGSFFYTQAKKLQRSSPLLTIRDNDLLNLPKSKYYGYIGAVRGWHLGKCIQENDKIDAILQKLLQRSDVVKFWRLGNFVQYVLVPEVIAMITMDRGKLKEIDDAYDEMEETNDYGVYVTNRETFPHVSSDVSDDDDDEEEVEEFDENDPLAFLND